MKAIFKAFDLTGSRDMGIIEWLEIIEDEVNEFLEKIQGKIVSVQMQVVIGNDSQYGTCYPSLFILVQYEKEKIFDDYIKDFKYEDSDE